MEQIDPLAKLPAIIKLVIEDATYSLSMRLPREKLNDISDVFPNVLTEFAEHTSDSLAGAAAYGELKLQTAYDVKKIDPPITFATKDRVLVFKVEHAVFKEVHVETLNACIKQLTIVVTNACIMHDYIASTFNVTTNKANYLRWQHRLEMAICRFYLGKSIDKETLYATEVPIEGFELLLRVASIITDGSATKWVASNLPQRFEQFDWSVIPTELLQSIRPYVQTYRLAHLDRNMIVCTNAVTGERINLFDTGMSRALEVTFLCAGQIVAASDSHSTLFFDIATNRCIRRDQHSLCLYPQDQQLSLTECDKLKDRMQSVVIMYCDKHIRVRGRHGVMLNKFFSPDSKLVALSHRDRDLEIWDVEECKCLHVLSQYIRIDFEVRTIVFSPDNSLCAIGCKDQSIIVFSLHNLSVRMRLYDCITLFTSFCFSPDSNYLAVAVDNFTIRVISLVSSNHLVLHGDLYDLLSMQFSPDGLILAAGNRSGLINVWRVACQELIQTIPTNGRDVAYLSFSMNTYNGLTEQINDELMKRFVGSN